MILAPTRSRPGARRGAALMYVTMALAALIAVSSLAVDVGHVHLVRSELRQAADAAARFAAQAVAEQDYNSARVWAADSARENKADGAYVTVHPQKDVDFGTWDAAAQTFTVANNPTAANADAVRVTVRRTAERNNPVRLSFAGVVGLPTYDVTVSAVARVNPRRPGIVGLDSITMSGSSGGSSGNATDSYQSKNGGFTGGTTPTYGHGTIVSNGNISLGGSTNIQGDARPGVGKTVSLSGGSSVSGITTPLSKPVDYPMMSAGPAATTNDNAALSPHIAWGTRNLALASSTATVPGGTYYVNDFSVGSSGSIAFTGPATLYVTGNVNVSGDIFTAGSVPSNLRIILVTSGTSISLGSGSVVYADIYAPGSVFAMGGTSTLCGSIIARTVSLGGSARVVFDDSLTTTSPLISLVR